MEKVKMEAGGYRFTFEESWWEYLEAAKCGECVGTIITARVEDRDGRYAATYRKEYSRRVDDGAMHNFINKFMADAGYRRGFLVDGGHVDAAMEEDMVHPGCRKAIERLNRAGEKDLRFNDYAALKTYGMDKVSRMAADELERRVGGDGVSYIKAMLDDGKQAATAMRWAVRGLKLEKCVRKVRTDAEINANAMAGKRKRRAD